MVGIEQGSFMGIIVCCILNPQLEESLVILISLLIYGI